MMTLSELLGDTLQITAEEQKFFEQSSDLWKPRFSKIIKESKGPRIKTRIVVKDKKNG